jgi:hypothetical protein
MKGFYLVFCAEKNMPKKMHLTAKEAEDEAKRLAKENIGFSFYICKSLYGYGVVSPEPEFLMLES